jgi:outer membrane protein TolC
MKLSTDLFGKTYKYETTPEFVKMLTKDMNEAEAKYKKIETEYDRERKKFFVIRKAIEQLTGKKSATTTKTATKPTTATETKENNS